VRGVGLRRDQQRAILDASMPEGRKRMAAYIIAEVDVTDPETYASYRAQTQATIEPYGGRFIVRGGPAELLEGDDPPARLVVIEFPDIAAARRFYDSPEYQKIIGIRQRAARSRLILVEGV
jgi:uncharacterized protein (DUF1330 family)